MNERRRAHGERLHAFLGVAFLGVAFFVAVFLGAAFLAAVFLGAAAAGALVLVTRPDLVLPRTRVTSFSTAGASLGAAAVLRGRPALALGLAAAAFLGAAFAAVFLGAAAFLVVVALAFYHGSQYGDSRAAAQEVLTVVVAFLALGAAAAFFSVLGSALAAAGSFASFLANFTVPEAPMMHVSNLGGDWREGMVRTLGA